MAAMDTSDPQPANPNAHLERLFPVPGEGYTWGPPEEPTYPVPEWDAFKTKVVGGHSRNVNKLAWNASGDKLASGSDDRTCRVWSGEDDYRHSLKLDGHGDSVVQLAWDPRNNESLATLAADKTVRLWDLREGRARSRASIKLSHEYINVAWSPCGGYLAVGSSVGKKEGDEKDCVTVLDAKTHKATKRFKFAYEVNEFCWAPDSRHLMLTTAHGTIEVLRAVEGGPPPVEFDKICSCDDDDIPKPHADSVWVARAHTDACYCVDLSVDCHGPPLLAVGAKDALVSIWDVEEMICLRCVPRHDTPVRCVAFSRYGQFVASSAYDAGIDIADTKTAERVATVEAAHAMNSLAWHPQKPVLAYAIDAKSKPDGRTRDEPPYLRLHSVPLPSGN